MTVKSLGRLGRSWSGSAYNSSDYVDKQLFDNTARVRLRRLAAMLELEPGTFEVRSNKAGMAVSGEVTLHGEHVYVQASHSCVGGAGILIRSCKGMRDYSGGPNYWVHGWDALDPSSGSRFARELEAGAPICSLEALAAYCRRVIERERARKAAA